MSLMEITLFHMTHTTMKNTILYILMRIITIQITMTTTIIIRHIRLTLIRSQIGRGLRINQNRDIRQNQSHR